MSTLDGQRSAQSDDGVVIRPARVEDVDAVCAFGAAHVPPHYTPLIGAEAARQQVTDWWRPEQIRAAVAAGRLLVADAPSGGVVGVAQYAVDASEAVIYKLYLDPGFRGHGLGPRLIAAVTRSLPADVTRLCIEHFAGNARAGAFYEREGFAVERVEPSASGRSELDVVWRLRPAAGPRA